LLTSRPIERGSKGAGIVHEIVKSVRGMRVVGVADRRGVT
jgi:hypothetical protein